MASSPDAGSTASTDSTAPRPPTPPREACREPAAAPLSKLVPVPARPDPLDSCPSPLQTPPTANTPTSVPPDSSIKSHRKKVEWSAHTEVKEYFDIRKLERLAKSSPASALSPRPIKGILKQSQSHNLGPPSSGVNTDGSAGQVSIIDMLGSTIKQLAGSDHHSKIDAYMMLSRALKASNNLPDRVALQSQMGLFMHFIQRDVSYKNPSGGGIDFSLTNHALTLLATFLYFPAVASTLTNDFGVWMLDYAIQAFENATASKDTLRHLMQIAATQTFSSKVMTSARVGRLVRALHKIESHVTGKSIVLSRLRIYKRLLKQSRGLMALYSDWLDNVFVDMLSGYQDIRDHAIALATEAGFALRSEMAVIRKVNEIFQAVHQDRTYIDFFVKRLNEMLGEKQTSAAVPQVWAAVILYLPYPLDRWPHYSPWLKVVQSAFNTDDGPTKQEANHAWNRHIYLTLHDVGKMSPKALSTLCLPLLTQIRKKANPKTQKAALRLRATVVGGICTVFYYLLAPDNDQHSHDFAWDTAVQPVIAELISLDGKPEIPPGCLMQAACLLLGLLDVTTPRAWGQDRIQKLPPVAPDELPSLDAKWIRRKCDKVMQAVRPIIEHKILELAKRDSVVFRMWQALVGSVAAASARDIKVSEDTVKFFACTFGLLSKPFLNGKTLVARLELISELLSIRPCNPSSSNGPWVLAARDFELLIESYHDGGVSNPTDSGRVLGPQYREIVTLLERGLAGYPNLPSEQWFSLFDRLSEHLVTKFGEAGRCIILIEPLAKALVELVDTQNEEMSATVLQAIRALFDLARFPRDRASLEIARHRLWGTPMNTARGSAFDPFEHLYKLGNHILEIFYKEFRRFDPDQEVSPIIEAIKDFISQNAG
ncbi:Telomere length regulator protein rif1 [Escovopsis weberi]|uniref:Telomere length regulator protein rif1 n=1 Tax=Escovopsis weberi TaxID=150374 RepID=A0A0M9VXL5_ESCWE|nr:Telomere length regulator protein rif1 [Escovopsis weberi]